MHKTFIIHWMNSLFHYIGLGYYEIQHIIQFPKIFCICFVLCFLGVLKAFYKSKADLTIIHQLAFEKAKTTHFKVLNNYPSVLTSTTSNTHTHTHTNPWIMFLAQG